MLNALGVMGLATVSVDQLIFVNMEMEDLIEDLVEVLPPQKTVLEILETAKPSPALLKRCKEWVELGYRLALDDFVYAPEWAPFIELADIIKLDVQALDEKSLASHVKRLKKPGMTLLAEKVEDQESYRRFLELGFDAFQGYFFARPEMLSGYTIASSTMLLLEAIQRIYRDEDVVKIENVLLRDPGLIHRFLRFAGSVAFGSRPPANLKTAIARVGYRNLQRWLMLELYASDSIDSSASEPLRDLAGYRAEFMGQLASHAFGEMIGIDEAAAVGCLSLLDTLLHRPMDQILEGLAIPEAMKHALLEHTGDLGVLLDLTIAIERADEEAVGNLINTLGIDPDDLMEIQTRALNAHLKLSEAVSQTRGV